MPKRRRKPVFSQRAFRMSSGMDRLRPSPADGDRDDLPDDATASLFVGDPGTLNRMQLRPTRTPPVAAAVNLVLEGKVSSEYSSFGHEREEG